MEGGSAFKAGEFDGYWALVVVHGDDGAWNMVAWLWWWFACGARVGDMPVVKASYRRRFYLVVLGLVRLGAAMAWRCIGCQRGTGSRALAGRLGLF